MRTLPWLLAVLAAIGLPIGSSSATNAAEPLKISIGWVVLSADMAPLVFEKPDILAHYGKSYTVEPIHFQGTSPEITALAAGQLDIASLAYSSFALAIENAHLDDIRVIADGFQDGHPDYASVQYMVRNGGGVAKVEDLKHKIVGINVIGAAVDIGARAVLAQHGLMFPRDYSIIESPFPAIGAMLLEGKANVVSMVTPFLYAPAIAKGAHTLFTMRDGMGKSQMILMVARKGFLGRDRAALDDFFEDWIRGIHWMEAPANRSAAIAFVSSATKQPASIYDPYYLTHDDEYHDPDAMPDLTALQSNIDAQVKFGFLKHPLDVAKYADLSFVRRAAQRFASDAAVSAK